MEIDSKFINDRGHPKSVTTIAKHLVLESTGFDFGETDEFLEWAIKVRNLRNELVHGKRFSVNKQEALSAYKATQDAINLLSSQ